VGEVLVLDVKTSVKIAENIFKDSYMNINRTLCQKGYSTDGMFYYKEIDGSVFIWALGMINRDDNAFDAFLVAKNRNNIDQKISHYYYGYDNNSNLSQNETLIRCRTSFSYFQYIKRFLDSVKSSVDSLPPSTFFAENLAKSKAVANDLIVKFPTKRTQHMPVLVFQENELPLFADTDSGWMAYWSYGDRLNRTYLDKNNNNFYDQLFSEEPSFQTISFVKAVDENKLILDLMNETDYPSPNFLDLKRDPRIDYTGVFACNDSRLSRAYKKYTNQQLNVRTRHPEVFSGNVNVAGVSINYHMNNAYHIDLMVDMRTLYFYEKYKLILQQNADADSPQIAHIGMPVYLLKKHIADRVHFFVHLISHHIKKTAGVSGDSDIANIIKNAIIADTDKKVDKIINDIKPQMKTLKGLPSLNSIKRFLDDVSRISSESHNLSLLSLDKWVSSSELINNFPVSIGGTKLHLSVRTKGNIFVANKETQPFWEYELTNSLFDKYYITLKTKKDLAVEAPLNESTASECSVTKGTTSDRLIYDVAKLIVENFNDFKDAVLSVLNSEKEKRELAFQDGIEALMNDYPDVIMGSYLDNNIARR
jgi:hypothetical protein